MTLRSIAVRADSLVSMNDCFLFLFHLLSEVDGALRVNLKVKCTYLAT